MAGKKSQISTFGSGMNLDTDKSLLKNNQYRYAENVRTITNEGATTGSLTSIEGSTIIGNGYNYFGIGEEIIATSTVRDLGVTFTRTNKINSTETGTLSYDYIDNYDTGSIFVPYIAPYSTLIIDSVVTPAPKELTPNYFYVNVRPFNILTCQFNDVLDVDVTIGIWVRYEDSTEDTFYVTLTPESISYQQDPGLATIVADMSKTIKDPLLTNIMVTSFSRQNNGVQCDKNGIENPDIFLVDPRFKYASEYYVYEDGNYNSGPSLITEPDIVFSHYETTLEQFQRTVEVVSIVKGVIDNTIIIRTSTPIDDPDILYNVTFTSASGRFNGTKTLIKIGSSSYSFAGAFTDIVLNKTVDIETFFRNSDGNVNVIANGHELPLREVTIAKIISSTGRYTTDSVSIKSTGINTLELSMPYTEVYANTFKIYRVTFTDDKTPIFKNVLSPDGIDFKIPEGAVLSIVCRYEDSDNIKVYWADGVNLIRVVNIAESNDVKNVSIQTSTMFDIVPSAALKQPSVASIGSGRLNSGLIQYYYQLYSPSGGETELSPASSIVHLTESSVGETSITYLGSGLGEIYGKPSGKSVRLSIELPEDNKFVRLKLISVYYFNLSDAPIISIVKEVSIQDSIVDNKIYIEDGGTSAIGELTQAEFNIIGVNLIKPTYIESKDNILFAANTTEATWVLPEYDTRAYQFDSTGLITRLDKSNGTFTLYPVDQISTIPTTDDCIHREIYEEDRYSDLEYVRDANGNLGGTGPNVSYLFVNTYFIESYGDFYKNRDGVYTILGAGMADVYSEPWKTEKDKYIDQRTARIGDRKRNISSIRILDSAGGIGDVSLSDFGIPSHNGFLNYADPYLSNNITSYQRDEIYRFAMVGYNEKGAKSDAKWIADIRFPAGYIESTNWNSSIFESPSELIDPSYKGTILEFQELLVKPLGLKFTFKNIPSEIKKIEIVRAKRDINNKTIYSQGVVQKTGTYRQEYQENEHGNIAKTIPAGLPNTLRPHPIISMGYSYSIAGPIRNPRMAYTAGAGSHTDGYSWHDYDSNTYYLDNPQMRVNTLFTDHSVSPYFYYKNSLLFINPETSYYGIDFTEQLRMAVGSITADVVDVIYPVSTPNLLIPSDGTTFGATYYGHTANDGFQFKPAAKVYPFAMHFGADITPRSISRNIIPSTNGAFCTMGLVGADYRRISGIGGNVLPTATNSNGNVPISDIKNPDATAYTEMADRGFISVGGSLSYTSDLVYRFKNGLDPDLADPSSSVALIIRDDSYDESYNGFSFKYFNRYEKNGLVQNSIQFIYQKDSNIKNVLISTLRSIDTKKVDMPSDVFVNGDKMSFSKKIRSFEYSGSIPVGKPIEKLSGSDYVSSGGSQYLNISSTLTTGNEGESTSRSNNTIIAQLPKTKASGVHGDGIVLNFDDSEQIPTISNINQDRKRYTQNEVYDGYKQLDRIGATSLSTMVVNLKAKNSSIYGGYGLVDRQFTEYISTGVVIENDATELTKVVFGGDTFIGIFDYTVNRASDPYCDYDTNDVNGRGANLANQTRYIGALIPLESSINMHLVNSKSYVADNYNLAIQKEPGVYAPGANEGSLWKYTQELPQYSYNSAYSLDRTGMGYESKLLITQDNKTFDCRVWSSEPKTNDEIYDSWSKFKVANYIDVDTQYGEITGLKKFDNKLFFWQKNAFGVLSVNERSLIKDNNISLLTLGTGGILSRFDYISTDNGMKKGMNGGIANSQSGLYWMDIDNSEICVFSNSLNPLSKTKGIQSILNSNKGNILNHIPMIFDKKYNEVMITLDGLQGVDNIQ